MLQNADVEQILKSKLMLNVTPEELEELDSQIPGGYKYYEKDSTIISEGDEMTFVSLILSGEVDVVRLFPGGEFIYMNKLETNRTIGIESMYQYKKDSYYYYNAGTDVELYNIPSEYITEANHIPESIRVKFLSNLLTILTYENYRQQKKIDILCTKSLRKRILMYLYDQREKYEKNFFDIPLSREEMAKYLGVNRSALSGELSKMKTEGILDYHRNHFKLLNI